MKEGRGNIVVNWRKGQVMKGTEGQRQRGKGMGKAEDCGS